MIFSAQVFMANVKQTLNIAGEQAVGNIHGLEVRPGCCVFASSHSHS